MAEPECSTAAAAADEDAKEKNEGTVYGGWRDSFSFSLERVERPSLSEFQLVLKELSPGLSALQLGYLENLALQGYALEQQGDEVSALPLYERMLNILIAALEGELVAQVPDFLPNFVWAFTWVKLVLLHHAMLQAPGSLEQMDASSRWWTLLHCLWPDDGSCKHTKSALDRQRRLALLKCGQETEAVAGFYLPESFRWKGLEKSFLLLSLSMKLYLAGHFDESMEWILRAEKAVPPKTRERAAYANLEILTMQGLILSKANLSKEAEENGHRFLQDVKSVDLNICDGDNPKLVSLKVRLLDIEESLISKLGKGERPLRELLGPVSYYQPRGGEEADEEQLHDQLGFLLLRGKQLRAQGRFVDALKEFQICLTLADVKEKKKSVEIASRFAQIDVLCRAEMLVTLRRIPVCDRVDRLDRLEKRRAFAREGVLLGLEQIGNLHGWNYHRVTLSHGIANLVCQEYWEAAVHFFTLLRAFLYGEDASRPSAAEFDDAKRAYWQSWEDCCYTYPIWVDAVAQRLRNTWGPADYSMTDYSYPYMSYFAVQDFHIRGVVDPHVWPPPGPPSDDHSLPVYMEDLARRALVCAERARACSVLPQDEAQPEPLKGEQALELTEWEMIKESQGACGPGTILVEYIGWATTHSVYIVDGDGTVSPYWLGRGPWPSDSTMINKSVTALLSAMHLAGKGNQQTADEVPVNDHLELLYEVLIEPVWATLKEPMKPHHKLIIVASGYFAHVPFTILRNKQTGRYLFQDVTVSVTPTLRLLHGCNKRYVELQKRPLYPGEGAAVAVGDAAYKFPTKRLPGSEEEVTAICNLFNMPSGGYKVAKLLQQEATVQGLLEWVQKPTSTAFGTRYSQGFIHIAAHGKVDDRQHSRGALQLAATRAAAGTSRISGAGGRDSPHVLHEQQSTPVSRAIAAAAELEAESVRAGRTLNALTGYLPSQHISTSGIEWSAYIAVLSACNTAAGQEVDGGTLNLGRAFITAGVPSTVLSLWPVLDGSTGHLMQLFYKALKQGEDASSALRSAMLIMLDDHRYGLHEMAPFIVSGLPTVCLPPELRACS